MSEEIKKIGWHIIWLTILFGVLGFFIHVALGSTVQAVVAENMKGVAILKPPYGPLITSIAGLTALIPALFSLVLYMVIRKQIPGKAPLIKGLFFGALILLLKGQLIRQPLMNYLVGNPLWVVVLQQSEIWLANFIPCILAAIIIEKLSSE